MDPDGSSDDLRAMSLEVSTNIRLNLVHRDLHYKRMYRHNLHLQRLCSQKMNLSSFDRLEMDSDAVNCHCEDRI